MGNFGLGDRNAIVQYAQYQKMSIVNTFLKIITENGYRKILMEQQRTKLTLYSNIKSEDASVLNKFRTGSDYRIIRVRIVSDRKMDFLN